MTTTSPLDTQANQMADEFAGCGYVGPLAKARFALTIKPLLARLHAQATQLTLAQHFASENERLKQRVKELEELQLLDVHAIYGAECDSLRAENAELRRVAAAIQELRSIGNLEEWIAKWTKAIELADAAMQTEKEKQ
jgi:hypothetical protein